MYVINRESGGSPKARNASSGASGLLQFMPQSYTGQWGYPAFNPYDARANLKAGVWLYRRQGWQPWQL
jgi:soluble lytic murein transglycosylase-like protein